MKSGKLIAVIIVVYDLLDQLLDCDSCNGKLKVKTGVVLLLQRLFKKRI
jgi:hypothetical protein